MIYCFFYISTILLNCQGDILCGISQVLKVIKSPYFSNYGTNIWE
jgi:hypothetical protein